MAMTEKWTDEEEEAWDREHWEMHCPTGEVFTRDDIDRIMNRIHEEAGYYDEEPIF